MDYEKKYKNALTIAQSRFKIEKDESVLTCLGMMFPELRESEDERIRKALVWHLKADVDFVSNGVTKAECLAYLEKQKYDRMKPIYDARESFESALEKAWNDYHNGYENVDKFEDDYVECAHAKGFREGYLFGIEKQKEQKSAWSEEDERIVGRIQMLLEFFDRNYPADMNIGSEVPKYISWLKSLRPSWKPCEEQMMKEFPKWRKIKAGERLPCPAYVWTIAYDNYPDCFEGRLMPNIQGVKVGRDTWYLPVDVIHNLPKED